jgi:CheY-like chemotaxis protein
MAKRILVVEDNADNRLLINDVRQSMAKKESQWLPPRFLT